MAHSGRVRLGEKCHYSKIVRQSDQKRPLDGFWLCRPNYHNGLTTLPPSAWKHASILGGASSTIEPLNVPTDCRSPFCSDRLPDRLIEYLPTLLNDAIQYYSCFISYSTNDQEFADRKLLLILSEHSLGSDWVEDEAEKAFDEERKRKQIVLFPIRIDDAVMGTDKAWARTLLLQRNIGHFPNWKDHSSYKTSFERLMRDLTSK